MASRDIALPARSRRRDLTARPAAQQPSFAASGSAAVVDTLLLAGIFGLAWWLRYVAQLILEVEEFNQVDFELYAPFMAGFIVLTVGSLYMRGLYRRRFGSTWLDDLSAVFSGTTTATMLLITATFFTRPTVYSRLMFIYVWGISIVLLAAWRLGVRLYQRWQWSRGAGLRRALIIGAGLQGRLIMQSLLAQAGLGYNVVGFLDGERHDNLGRFRWLGKPGDLAETVDRYSVEEVIIALPSTEHGQILKLMEHCADAGVEFRLVPDFFDLSLDRVGLKYIDGIPLIGMKESALRGVNALVKRGLDLAVSFTLLALLAPISIAIMLAIKLDSPGPIFYHQRRVGRDGRHFTFLKFRTMRVTADAERQQLLDAGMDGGRFKLPNDPRRTRVGRWLRRFSLDEIPQFAMVLRGDMSLVGPRPPLPDEAARYDEWSARRLAVSPGLTGVWQVSGRSDLPFEDMVLLDRWYIENWSLGLDLNILLRTVPAVLTGRGAY